MQDKKNYILSKSFEVFLAKGYDSASMTVLQKELNISRGAMYRYFESKDDLLKAVVDKYFFSILDELNPNQEDSDITLIEKIDHTYLRLKKIGQSLDNMENLEIKFLNFTALMIQAAKRYPGFLNKLKIRKAHALRFWEKAIRNSITKGEVRSDVEVEIMAKLFAKAINFSDDSEELSKSFLRKIKNSQKIMMYIYSLVKV